MSCGLWLMPFGNSEDESQRDSGTKPRVARNELPWVAVRNGFQPQRGCGRFHRRAATLLGLFVFARFPHGSSFLATLG